MRLIRGFVVAPTLVLFVSALVPAQGQEASRSVAGGGVSVPGWTGQVDAGAEKAGQTVNDTKLTQTGRSEEHTSELQSL